MSDRKLDELSRALATTTSRRQMLKVLAATAVGGMVRAGARELELGRCRRVGQPCRANFECCDFFCHDTGRCACRPGENLCTKTKRCISCDPRRRSTRTRASASARRGRRSAATSAAAETRNAAPAATTARHVASGRDLLPGRLLLVLRGPVLGT